MEYVSTLNDAGILDEFNARRPLVHIPTFLKMI